MTEMKYRLLPIQEQIWKDKYRFVAPAGVPRLATDDTIEDTWRRIARALSAPELHDARMWEKRFYGALENFAFLPAGRIVAGAGTNRDVTLFNCFVLGEVPDSMDGIFSRLKDGALTQQQGGGIGTDFSTLRPNGAEVKGVAAKASGPLSFMDCWDAMCKTIMSAGARRGAMMGTLRCDHPDIEAFIDAKKDPLRFRNFNLSVLVTTAFMEAVKNDFEWRLCFGGKEYHRVKARELWLKIMRSAYETAEPGVIFIDRINSTNNLVYCETIHATNPCAEQPLPPNGACLLGSLNLTAFVRKPFMPEVYIDEQDLVAKTKIAVRMLDNVIDVSNYPLKEQREEALAKRRIGLGITGLADALAMCGLHYGSPTACSTAALWMKTITQTAYETSINLAAEKGAFPLFSKRMVSSCYPERGDRETRNSHLISIAPTGTISLLAGNISSGIEPIYEWEFSRNITMPDGSRKPVKVEDYAVRLYRELCPDKELPPELYARAHELSPKQHLAMQAALQPFVDSSISKTVNCPKDMTFEDFEQLYMEAYNRGLKACAAFRPNEVTGSILEPVIDLKVRPPAEIYRSGKQESSEPCVDDTQAGLETWVGRGGKQELLDLVHAASGKKAEVEQGGVYAVTLPSGSPGLQASAGGSGGASSAHVIAPRPKTMSGKTHKIKWNGSAVFVTINNDETGLPYEIFVNSLDSSHYAYTIALTRMISAIWRRGGDVSFVTEELKRIADPRGGVWLDGRYIPSLPAAIGHVIEQHLGRYPDDVVEKGSLGPINVLSGEPHSLPVMGVHGHFPTPSFCSNCGSTNVWFPKPNCLTCRDCSFSNCD